MATVLYSKQKNVLVDTSALLAVCESKADIFEIETEIGKVKYFVTSSVLSELERLAEKEIKKAKYLRFLKPMLEKFEIIEDNGKYADKSFIDLAKEDYLFVTNDSALARSLKQKGKRVFRLNTKKRFVEI